jgi:hypothetical protein
MRKSALLTAIAALAASHVPAEAIGAYVWKKRPLLVFAESDKADKFDRQRRMVEDHRTGLQERDVVVVYVVADEVTSTLGPAPGMKASALRRKYGIKHGEFRAILIGKDGGVKRVAASPMSFQSLAGIIDAMPMRRDEARRQRKG